MSDEIQGVAVLNDLVPEQILFVVCVPDRSKHPVGGEPFISRLPVRPASAPRGREIEWHYEVDGGELRVRPSVSVKTTRPIPGKPDNEVVEIFHNGGDWRVRFVRYSEIYPAKSTEGAWSVCWDLNAAVLGHPHP